MSGVYVGEGRGPRAIIGVDTDVAGFAGVTERGPTAPTLVTSWTDFAATFGGFIDRPPFVTPYWRLPYAVRGFFENGGRRLYIARVLDAMAPASADDLAAVVGDVVGGAAGPAAATGIAGLMAQTGVALVAVPDEVAAPSFAAALLDRCDQSRDRLAIVSGTSGAVDPSTVQPPRDTGYAAFYYPHLHVPAPHLPRGYALVPPCGHVAGCLARTVVGATARADDRAPVLTGLVSDTTTTTIEPLDRRVTALEGEGLAARGVNALRDFRAGGRGVRVWGARTASSDPEWKYVPVRRLLLFLERSLERGTQWVVFEPNAEPTWTALRAQVEAFLHERWQAGAFVGATPREAFFVRCDRSTMTRNDLDNGRLVCLVGVAPLRPAEFVIFRIGQWTADRP